MPKTEKEKEYQRLYYAANLEKMREKKREYRKLYKDRAAASVARYRGTAKGKETLAKIQERKRTVYQKKRDARNALTQALLHGDLTKQPCEVCGDPKSEGHHADYDKPLEVRWLCTIHHHAVHRKVIDE